MWKNTSGYTGVAWHKKSGKWRAQLCREGKTQHVGLYPTKREAAIAHAIAKSQAPPKYHTRRHGGRKNKSGYIGVSWHKSTKKWIAQICQNSKNRCIGLYTTKREAITARKVALAAWRRKNAF